MPPSPERWHLRLLDRLLPDREKASLESRHRARLTLGTLLFVGGACLLNGVNLLIIDGTIAAGGLLVSGVSALLLGGFLRGRLSQRFVAQVLLYSALAFVLFAFWVTGGLYATITVAYLIAVPMGAQVMLGRREAVAMAGVVVAALVGMWWLHTHPALPQPPPYPGGATPSYLLTTELILLALLFGPASFQLDLNLRQQVALEAARQRADQANEAKSAFLANMSHELRTPMHGVLGLTQALLAADRMPPDQRETLEAIQRSGRSLVQLLDGILDFSKIEAGRFALEPMPMQPQAVAEEVLGLLREAAAEKGLALRLESDAPGWVRADPTRLRQILLNLVGNAIKFTPSGAVTVSVRAHDGRLAVAVSDTGIGIDPAAQGLLFQPFTQADASTSRRFGGTGLGLAISRRLVSLMGGEIRLRSRIGAGSTFSFTVAAPACAAPACAAPAQARAAPARADICPLRVLVAEDHPVNQLVIQKMLAQLGIAPELVSDGAQALDAVRRQQWDVVLMDAHMPGMDGFEATRRIRALGLDVFIVALTASTTAADRASCEAAGMDAFLPKPLDLAQLRQIVQQRSSHEPAVGG